MLEGLKLFSHLESYIIFLQQAHNKPVIWNKHN